jgi:hypothetical protein
MRERPANERDETMGIIFLRMEARGVAYVDEGIQTIQTYLKRNSKK